MKARKEEKSSLCGVLMVLVAIAVGVAGIVYAAAMSIRKSGKITTSAAWCEENFGSFLSARTGLFQSIFPWKCKTEILFW